jgi:hypothetical protein
MENNANTREFSPEASLKVIYDMIESTKSSIGKNYFYYLFWGYLVAFTCIVEFILISAEYSRHYMVWPVFMIAGTIVTLVFYFRQEKSATSRTFIGSTMGFLWIGWFISFCIMILFVNLKQSYGLILPMIMNMFGLSIFIAGGMVNFKPLLIGAVVAWVASVVAFFVDYPVQLMILAGMVVISHIIPGHILKNQSKA